MCQEHIERRTLPKQIWHPPFTMITSAYISNTHITDSKVQLGGCFSIGTGSTLSDQHESSNWKEFLNCKVRSPTNKTFALCAFNYWVSAIATAKCCYVTVLTFDLSFKLLVTLCSLASLQIALKKNVHLAVFYYVAQQVKSFYQSHIK